MGVFDDVVGMVRGAAGGGSGEHSALVNEVLGVLSSGSEGGGLQGVIQSFKDKGLGDIISSWIGTGQNLPISGEQLKTGLGADLLGQLASKIGVSPDVAASKLSEVLPGIVDKLTPEGKVPESGLLQQGLNFLRGNLPKS